MIVLYIIQYRNHPSSNWIDCLRSQEEGKDVSHYEKNLALCRKEQPEREWRLIERTEEVIG